MTKPLNNFQRAGQVLQPVQVNGVKVHLHSSSFLLIPTESLSE